MNQNSLIVVNRKFEAKANFPGKKAGTGKKPWEKQEQAVKVSSLLPQTLIHPVV
jgi:hypothetical protein